MYRLIATRLMNSTKAKSTRTKKKQATTLSNAKLHSPSGSKSKNRLCILYTYIRYKSENQLRSYQLEGLNWLMYCWYKKQNSILADEMGLGKTVQSTAFLYQLFTQENVKGPFLIVVPLSTMGNWEREIRGWTDMNLVTFHGNAMSRNLIIETEFYYRDEQVYFHLISGTTYSWNLQV